MNKHITKANGPENFLWEVPRYFLLIALVLAMVIFGSIRSAFFNVTNIMDLLRTSSVICILALGGTVLMSTGDMNFSMGAQATLSAAVVGVIMAQCPPWMYPIAILISIVICCGIALISAFLVVRIGVPAFIATLALQTVINGLIKILTHNVSLFSKNWGDTFVFLGQSYLFKIIPMPLVIAIILTVIFYVLMEKTQFGRHVFAIGANATACRQVGVRVDRIRLLAFVCCSVSAALAGVVQASILNTVSVDLGNNLLMPAMATIMLSATFLQPGKYNIPGTFVAAIVMSVVDNGIRGIGAMYYYTDIVQGAMLVIAVGIIALIRKGGLPTVTFGN